MSSSLPAKHAAEYELNTLAAGMIGIIGVSLLLLPSHIERLIHELPHWAGITLGLFAYAVSISFLNVSVMSVPHKRREAIRWAGILFLFLFAWINLRAGYIIESIVLFSTLLMQVLLASAISQRAVKVDLLKTVFAITGVSSGVYLRLAGGEYPQVDINLYNTYLAIVFLVTSLAGICPIIFPALKFGPMISRLQAIPWLMWCAAFVPSLSVVNLIVPVLLLAAILFDGLLPWDRLTISDENILSRRIIMITSTLVMSLLIFLSAVLIVIENSLDIGAAFLVTTGEAVFLFFVITSVAAYCTAAMVIMVVNGIMAELTGTEEPTDDISTAFKYGLWNNRLTRYIKPFVQVQDKVRTRMAFQSDQIGAMEIQIGNEKKRNAQLTLLLELSQQLENQLDQPVAAQLAVNSLERALHCSLASLYIHEPDRKEFMLLAAAGRQINMIPHGFRQSASKGALGRAMRQRKTQIINDITLDAHYIPFENENNLSAVVVPLIYNGHVNGALVLNSEKANAFSSIDIGLIEAAAEELIRAWERSNYHQRLMNLVQAGSQLSAMVNPSATTQEIASIARDVLQARFTFVQIQLRRERNFFENAFSGQAPRLLISLQRAGNSESLIETTLNAVQPFRIRDIRKNASTSHLILDNAGFRSMLAIPIRWHRMSIGVILAFGKQNEVFFNENDQSLAELLSIQAAGVFESTWLQEELRTSLRTTSLLHRLSNQIIQADNLQDAATEIAKTAHDLAKSNTTGIVLFNLNGTIATKIEVNSMGVQTADPPADIIRDAMNSGQLIYLSRGQSLTLACLPIQTPLRKYGAVWMDLPEEPSLKQTANTNDLQALVSQAAIALERSLLLVESRRQAIEIKAAYDKLETTYDQTLAALMTALDARDRETEGHSLRVSHLAAQLGEALNFSHEQLKVLERGSLLHDIGKIGISDTILHKPGPLSMEEWKIMRTHPDIGAKIVEGIPFLQETIPLIRFHQERWDGTGYPVGLRGEDIPILARMFAIVDAFDALTSKRPYRQKSMTVAEALKYLREQSGILFDPKIVVIFEKLIIENPSLATTETNNAEQK